MIKQVAEEYVSEAEGSLKPSIRIPLQVSHGLQSLLFGICFELGKIGPQSIPKNVRDEFRFTVGQKLAEFYAGIDLKELTPQAALQLIFDLKYVQWFHPKLSTVTEPILAKFEALIDPFDMDIVGPKLKVNLKRCLFENHVRILFISSLKSHCYPSANFSCVCCLFVADSGTTVFGRKSRIYSTEFQDERKLKLSSL